MFWQDRSAAPTCIRADRLSSDSRSDPNRDVNRLYLFDVDRIHAFDLNLGWFRSNAIRSNIQLVLAASFLAVAGIGSPSPAWGSTAENASEAPTAIPIQKGVVDQGTLHWTPCERDDISRFECATLTVPLDRHGVQAGEVKLAVIRSPATGTSEERIGSVFFNPGGPGGSGLDFFPHVYEQMPERMARHYDLVSWDPRGVGATLPALVDCPMPWVERPVSGEVPWKAVFEKHYGEMEKANHECQKANAPYVTHLGTMNVVQDLDALRQAVGDEKLALAGYSYGTRIGSVYAQVYPEHMGPVLLDGAVDPSGGVMRFVAEGGRAMDEALGHYFQFEPEARRDIDAAWRLLSEKPVVLSNDSRFTRWDFHDIALLNMTFQADMPKIGEMARRIIGLDQAAASERDDTLDLLRKALTKLGPNTDTGGMFAVVNCLDYTDRPTLAELADIVDDNASRGGWFGGSLTSSYAASCAGFDFEPDPIPLARPIASEHPVLIGGATRDSRTPYQWSVQMARAFPNSRILTYPGGNHVNWFISSACLKSVMDDYFVDGRLPQVDAVCEYAPTPAR